MKIEEAIKLLKKEPDFSLSYYKRENAIDIVLQEIERLHSIIKEVRKYIEEELSQGGERDIRDLVNGYAILEILDKENE